MMNYFLGIGTNIFAKIENLTDEITLLQKMSNLYYPFFHFSYRLDYDDMDKIEFENFSKKTEEEWEKIKNILFMDGQSANDIIRLDETAFLNYCSKKGAELESTLDKIKNYIDDDTAMAFSALYTAKRAYDKKINLVDIDNFDFAFLVGAEIIDDILTDVADFLKRERAFFQNSQLTQEQILNLKEIISEYGLDRVFDKFLHALNTILLSWQSNTVNDISFVTVDRFYENNGEKISAELKTNIEKILLDSDKEYQKFLKEFDVKGLKVGE